MSNYVPVSNSGAASRGAGLKSVVGTGENRPGGDTGSGSSDGGREGLGVAVGI